MACESPGHSRPTVSRKIDGCGLRYHVKGWSVHLVPEKSGSEEWVYTFELERMRMQGSIQRALLRPNEDELDDWKEYLETKEYRVKELSELEVSKKEGMVVVWG